VVVHSWWAFTVVAALDKVADAANNAARGALIGRVGASGRRCSGPSCARS
jgi:hypothetical protein